MADTGWTDIEFARFTRRMKAFKANPESLTPAEYQACFKVHLEIDRDAKHVEALIARGVDLSTESSENPKRAALVEWLAKFPD